MSQICLFCGREVDMAAGHGTAYRVRHKTLEEILCLVKQWLDRAEALAEQYSGVRKQGLYHEIVAYRTIIRSIQRLMKEGQNESH